MYGWVLVSAAVLGSGTACAPPNAEDLADHPWDAGPASEPPADAGTATPLSLQEAAEAISARCLTEGCYEEGRLDQNEMQIVFAAAAEQEDISVRMLKAVAFGEGIATAYSDKWPRHFIDLNFAPGLQYQAQWASAYLGIDLPLMLGDDRQFDSQTFGLGVVQTTASISEIRLALQEYAQAEAGELACGDLRYEWQSDWDHPERTCTALLLGGGVPGSYYPFEVRMDVHRVIYDPFYEVLIAARLIRHKINIYSHPDRPNGPLSWVSADPDSEEDPDYAWALIGSTYQTYGGFGPGGGATERIWKRMTGVDEEAWPFVSNTYQLSAP